MKTKNNKKPQQINIIQDNELKLIFGATDSLWVSGLITVPIRGIDMSTNSHDAGAKPTTYI